MRAVLSLIALTSILTPAGPDWTDVSKRVAPSVVYVESDGGSCTGFVIDAARHYVLSDAHCDAKDTARLWVDRVEGHVVSKDTKKDLLVIEVKDLDPSRPALVLAEVDPVMQQDVLSVGYGYALERPQFRRAGVADTRLIIAEDGIGGPLISIDAAFVPGQSGGPVVNGAGEVVSIVQRATDRMGVACRPRRCANGSGGSGPLAACLRSTNDPAGARRLRSQRAGRSAHARARRRSTVLLPAVRPLAWRCRLGVEFLVPQLHERLAVEGSPELSGLHRRERTRMRVYLKLAGKYIGVDPVKPGTVYTDRTEGGGWEVVELTRHEGGHFDAKFVAANVQLSVQPDGRLETRPAGTFGAYEQLRATSQPEGLDLLYRDADGAVLGVPLTIETVK
jgi:hypothetical protein